MIDFTDYTRDMLIQHIRIREQMFEAERARMGDVGREMTPEERAVCEAAVEWQQALDGARSERILAEKVLALRKSREPKPRWYVSEGVVKDRLRPAFYMIPSANVTHEDMERIAVALNAAEAAKR